MALTSQSDYFSFFFNDPATTEIYTLSLHDALPICRRRGARFAWHQRRDHTPKKAGYRKSKFAHYRRRESEEHTSELQSPVHLVCRLLLEKKKKTKPN